MIRNLVIVGIIAGLLTLVSLSSYKAGSNATEITWRKRMEEVNASNAIAAKKFETQLQSSEKLLQDHAIDSASRIHDLQAHLKNKPAVRCVPGVDATLDPDFKRLLLTAACDPVLPHAPGSTACPGQTGNTTIHP